VERRQADETADVASALLPAALVHVPAAAGCS